MPNTNTHALGGIRTNSWTPPRLLQWPRQPGCRTTKPLTRRTSLACSFSWCTYGALQIFWQYNDINNQQDATTFSFINLLKSALNVLGDKFVHPQEHFLTVYTAFCSIPTVAPVGSSVGALYQKLYIQSKSAPEDGRICRPKHVGLI
jgi:hypothetical protein